MRTNCRKAFANLVVADIMGITHLLPCLCLCLHWHIQEPSPLPFSPLGGKKPVSLPPQVPSSHHRALLLPLHSTKPKGPGTKGPILASNTSFSSLWFSNIFFCQFLIFFSSQASECCQFRHRAQCCKSFLFPLCLYPYFHFARYPCPCDTASVSHLLQIAIVTLSILQSY